MTFVGLDIDKCTALKAHLDQACQDLNAHAANVEAALKQAGIQSCQAPAEIRDVAAWADYRSRDLQKRIDRARAADTGAVWGSRFGGNRADGCDHGPIEGRGKFLFQFHFGCDLGGVEVLNSRGEQHNTRFAVDERANRVFQGGRVLW